MTHRYFQVSRLFEAVSKLSNPLKCKSGTGWAEIWRLGPALFMEVAIPWSAPVAPWTPLPPLTAWHCPDAGPTPAQFHHALPVEDPLGVADGHVLPGSGVDGLLNHANLVVLLVPLPAGLGLLPVQGSFEFGCGAQDVEQKPRGRVQSSDVF